MNSVAFAKTIRQHALRMTHQAKASHIGSCLSVADILACLYTDVCLPRDTVIVSKGHAAAIVYAVLTEKGYFNVSELDTFCQDGSILHGLLNHEVPGVRMSTGSLGLGLGAACGIALAYRTKRVFVLCSDGEMNEGSFWEAVMFAAHHKLNNLVLIIDANSFQALGRTEDIVATGDYISASNKFREFRWTVRSIDGHDHLQLITYLRLTDGQQWLDSGFPYVIIAKTIKGKGVSFMEDNNAWHYKNVNDEEYAQAMAELA